MQTILNERIVNFLITRFQLQLKNRQELIFMVDVHNAKTRSYNMSQIHGKDTKPEEKVRKQLFALGFRYRKNDARHPGKPDIVLPKYNTVIFVNGCFWHKHDECKYFTWPKDNAEFWRKKIEGNVLRDNKNYEKLSQMGWHVLIIWECELRKQVFQKSMESLITGIREQV